MPILQTDEACKYSCSDCSWHIIQPKRTHGDVLGHVDIKIQLGLRVCPECGSDKIHKIAPSFLEILNPAEKRKWEAFINIPFI